MSETTESMGQWAHDVAAQYRALAKRETWAQRRTALEGAAAQYEGIGRRMDRIPPLAAPAAADDAGRAGQ